MLVVDGLDIAIEDDAFAAGQRYKPFPLGAADQGEPGQTRKVDLWTARHMLATVPFADQPVDPFFNANRPEDLEIAAALLKAAAG